MDDVFLRLIIDVGTAAACVVAIASIINGMTPDAERYPKFAAWVDFLSMNVNKGVNDPWAMPAMPNRSDLPPSVGEALEKLNRPPAPNRRAAIAATKKKHANGKCGLDSRGVWMCYCQGDCFTSGAATKETA